MGHAALGPSREPRPRGGSRTAPRTRIALPPPPHDPSRSGLRRASARRGAASQLREVRTERAVRPRGAPSAGGHHGGTSCSSATSQSQPASAAANSAASGRPAGGCARPWNRFQVRMRTPDDRTLRRLPRHFLTGWELSASDLTRLLDRAAALKAAPRASRALEGRSVALMFEKPSTRTRDLVRSRRRRARRPPDGAARRRAADRRAASRVRDIALVLSRHVAAIGLRTGSEETLPSSPRTPPCRSSTCSRPSHHPCQALADLMTMREAFGASRAAGWPTSATATTSRARWRSWAALAGVEVTRRLAARLRAGGPAPARARDRPARGGRGRRRRLHRRLGLDERRRRRGRRAARGARAYRLDDALLDRAAPGAFALHCLPAHPGEEITAAVLYGDAPAHLGPGREPPPRPEGAAGMDGGRCAVGLVRASRQVARQQAPRAGRRGACASSSSACSNPLDLVVLTRERLQEAFDDAVAARPHDA